MKSDQLRISKSAEENTSSMKFTLSDAKMTNSRLVSYKTIERFASNHRLMMNIVAVSMLLVLFLCLAGSVSAMPAVDNDRAPIAYNGGIAPNNLGKYHSTDRLANYQPRAK